MDKSEDVYGSFYVSRKKEKNPPKFSFIISAYNAADTLDASLKSIYQQTYKNFNIFIANDGSKDNTADIINSYVREYDNIIYIEQSNIGLTKTLNRLINLVDGDYVVRQDADDFSLPDRLKMLCDNFSLNDKFVITSSLVRYGNGHITKEPRMCYIKNLSPNKNGFIFGNPFIHGTFAFERVFIQSYKYDDNYRYAQDFELLLRVIVSGVNIKYIDTSTYEFIKSEVSISYKKKKEQTEFAKLALRKHGFTDKFILADKSLVARSAISLIREIYLRINVWI